jgi:hypothetical protein
MEYASRAVGNAGLATGIIGTALGALNGAGGLVDYRKHFMTVLECISWFF